MRILSILAATTLAFSVAAPCAPATPSPFGRKHFVYRAEGKKLAEVIEDFAASQNMPAVVDSGVEGNVNANFNARPEEFLSVLSRTYGIVWYFDGTTLFVYPSRAMQSRLFHMRGYDRHQVRQMLDSLGLGDARFPLRFDDANRTLLAYGPPRHIELVSSVVAEIEHGNLDRVGKSIQVFPLHFATAGDRNFGSTRVPGLASTLNSLFTAGASASARGDADAVKGSLSGGVVGQADRARVAQMTYGAKLPDGSSSAGARRDDIQRANQLGTSEPSAMSVVERPFFQADEATNAIIVRGLPERMREYETLIRQLDVAQDLVEIEASIIDVSSDDFDSLGIDWTYSVNGTTRLSLSPDSPATSTGGASTDTLSSGNITTLLTDAGKQLLAHIHALEGNGKAHILARPKVLGAVNRTATMTDKRVASVRVAGNLDANLFTIEAGTTLQVTPQIVDRTDHRDIRLSLSIQDGDFEGTTVDQVPIVKQTQITTEASVREGESLLVGGITVDSDSLGSTGVPLLSRIPLLGALFRHEERSASHAQRLFLLTPKVVSLGAPQPPAAKATMFVPRVWRQEPVRPVATASVASAPARTGSAPVIRTASSSVSSPSTVCATVALGLASACETAGEP